MAKGSGLRKARCVRKHMADGMTKTESRTVCNVKGTGKKKGKKGGKKK